MTSLGVDREHLGAYLRSIYAAGTVVGESGKEFSITPHGLPQEHGTALQDLAMRAKAVHTLETGFCFGLSTLSLCDAIAASGRPEAHHVVMDPRQARFDKAGLRTIREAGVSELVEFFEEGSEFVLPRLLAEGRTFDLAFIDGDHRFEGAFVDLYFIHQLVKPGGLIVVDDVWMPAVRLAVSFFVTNVGLEIEPTVVGGRLFTGAPALLREQLLAAPKARVAVLRRPLELPQRHQRHFEPFADWETGKAPVSAITRTARRRCKSALARVKHSRGER